MAKIIATHRTNICYYRPEYISQLELSSQKCALMEENTRLSDLNYLLLSSPSFSDFLITLAINPLDAEVAQVP
jgi:bZIP-type transcription factor MBZ1